MPVQALVSLSLSARHAPLDVREPFAVLPDELAELADQVRPRGREALLLSTCNRFELYAVTEATPEELIDLLAHARGVDPRRLRRHVRVASGREAAEHLLRVAAGLESVVLGETQILGQVRRALDAAREQRLVGHRLGALAQQAIATGKRVQEQTALGRGALSVARVAVDAARRQLGDLSRRTVLLIGAGETGQLAAKALDGAGRLLVINRTAARAVALANRVGAEALGWSALADAVAIADVVVCCVGARIPTLTRPFVARVQERRGGRPLLLVDLAAPRAIEPGVGGAGVRVIALDDLRARRTASWAERLKEVPKAEAIIAEELDRAWQTWTQAEAHEAVAALRQRADEVRQAELARSRTLRGLAPEQVEAVQALTRAVVNKLLHEPTRWLKAHPATAEAALQDIFGIRSLA